MDKDKSSILSHIKSIVVEKEPTAQIYLYGSRSRGTHRSESDWDILILIDKPHLTFEQEQEILYSLYELEFEIGEIISPKIYTQNEWNTKYSITPFFKNVMKEGVVL